MGPDYHVEFEGHRYSVPSDLVGRQVELRIAQGTVEIFVGTRRLFTHPRSLLRRGFTTEPAHMPSHHKEYAEWTPERIERWALTVGPEACEFVARLLRARVHPEQAFESCMGVISVAKSHGKDRLEAACQRALTYRAYSYRNVKTILEKGLDKEASQAQAACRSHLGARYFRTPRLLAELGVARRQGTMRVKLASLARVGLIDQDDWLLAPLNDLERTKRGD